MTGGSESDWLTSWSEAWPLGNVWSWRPYAVPYVSKHSMASSNIFDDAIEYIRWRHRNIRWRHRNIIFDGVIEYIRWRHRDIRWCHRNIIFDGVIEIFNIRRRHRIFRWLPPIFRIIYF